MSRDGWSWLICRDKKVFFLDFCFSPSPNTYSRVPKRKLAIRLYLIRNVLQFLLEKFYVGQQDRRRNEQKDLPCFSGTADWNLLNKHCCIVVMFPVTNYSQLSLPVARIRRFLLVDFCHTHAELLDFIAKAVLVVSDSQVFSCEKLTLLHRCCIK